MYDDYDDVHDDKGMDDDEYNNYNNDNDLFFHILQTHNDSQGPNIRHSNLH